MVEKLLSFAKKDTSKNSLIARRRLNGIFFDKSAVQKMFEVLVPRFAKIQSGYVKVYKLGRRLGDNAEMVLVKLAPGEPVEVKIPTKEKVKNAPKDTPKAKSPKSGKTDAGKN